MKKLLVLLLATLLLNVLSANDYRTFTSVEGQEIVAKVISQEGDLVMIEREDRRRFTIPMSRLSEVDRSYLASLNITELIEIEDEADLEDVRVELSQKYPIDQDMLQSEQREVMGQAYNHLRAEDFEAAIEAYASIPQKSSYFADARRRGGYNVLGRELGRWEEALVFLLDAYEVDPKNEKVLEDLGRAYIRLDMYDEARTILKEAGTKNAREALKEIKGL